MKLLRIFVAELSVSPWKLLGIAGLAGLSNALILAVINGAAEHATESNVNLRYVGMFFIALAVYVIAQRFIMVTSTTEVEHIIHRLRTRITKKISSSELAILDGIGRAKIYAGVTKEATTISQAAPTMVIAVQSGILIFFCVAYIAWLSRMAFVLTAVVTAVALVVHFRQVKKVNKEIHTALNQENRLFDSLSDILNGFKEAKMNSARNAGLHQHTLDVSEKASEMKARVQSQIVTHFVFSQVSFYFLLATVVFLLPTFSQTFSDVVTKTTTAILFLIGPITSLVGSIPIFLNSNAATTNILELEDALQKSDGRQEPAAAPISQTSFKQIGLHAVHFRYPASKHGEEFSIGPLDLTISRGETLFITGGNGSGKSTLLMILTGLLYPNSGDMRLDKRIIQPSNAQGYRDLIAAIFSDYYLFKNLYGLPADAHEQVHDLLELLELTDKTDLIDDTFTNINLSSGQRKRLALMTSLLENRPIHIFDEWAADQDPVFRRKFYEEILPDMKKKGKTIIAVTHDDRYFDCADRIIRMEEGQITSTGPGDASW
jgi:putative pyoverdin transport system ATP-binding/permease protein